MNRPPMEVEQWVEIIKNEIKRYVESGYKIPIEWIEEYNELVAR